MKKYILLLILPCLSLSAWGQAVIPQEVKQATIVALKGSAKDNMHEEAFKWGKDASGNVLVSPSIPGLSCTQHVCHSGFTPADPSIDARLVTVEGFTHVHPQPSLDHNWVQTPSKADLAFAADTPTGTINIVIAAGDKKIYFFNSKGVTSTEKLKDFLK